MARPADQVLAELLALPAEGWALPRDPGSNFAALLAPPAVELARFEAAAEALLAESDPRRAEMLLPEWERMVGLPDPCAPNVTLTRASAATFVDGAGVLREVGTDQLRPNFDLAGRQEGYLLEAASTNRVRNPRAEGAAAGTPGTLPTYWWLDPLSGLSQTVIGAGIEAGFPFLDVRITGIAGATGDVTLWFEASNAVAAAVAQRWTLSARIKLIAGGFAGTTTLGIPVVAPLNLVLTELNAGLGGAVRAATSVPLPTTRPLALQRVSVSRTLTGGATAYLVPGLSISLVATQILDVTLRISVPQLELQPAASSEILPPAGAPGVASRAADTYRQATVFQRQLRLAERLTGRRTARPADFIALAASIGVPITITEHHEHHCELDCETGISGPDWNFTWTVNAPATPTIDFTCLDDCETPLASFGLTGLECFIRRGAPPHTYVRFAYS